MPDVFTRKLIAAVAWTALGGAALAQQQERFPQLKLEDTSGAQRTLAERMLKETRTGMGGPWNVALRSPVAGQALMDLYNYYRYNSSLSARLVEFGILITSREWSSPFEWQVHYPLAVKEGVSVEALADLKAGKRPAGLKPDELAMHDLATELLRQHFVSDGTYRRAKAALGAQGVVDAATLVGTYVAFAALLNVGEVFGPDSKGPEFLSRPGDISALPQTPGAKGDQQRHYRFEEAKQEMPYHLYVPQKYDGKTPMPLIVALHGAGGQQDYFFRTNPNTQELCEKYGFILVAPLGYHAFGGYGAGLLRRPPGATATPPDPRRPDWSADELKRVNELSEKDVRNVLAIVEHEYRIDSARVYLMGHSMGGNGTWYLGQKYAEKWAGLGVLSGGFGYVDYPAERIKGIPLFTSAGSKDTAIHGDLARAALDKLRAAGLDPVYVEIGDGTHMSMIPGALPQVLEFFATHHR
ncbi:MAG TPA: alpha/beta hydrolase-fold protein [Candidatus Acidoferrales bacterium]|jgi:4-carboxymuconolactone decarboxylase|nr:alpha/beta hydrolase-fold protein [Candidatus Acidoferrales bacterium]